MTADEHAHTRSRLALLMELERPDFEATCAPSADASRRSSPVTLMRWSSTPRPGRSPTRRSGS